MSGGDVGLAGMSMRLANVGKALRLDGVVHFLARRIGAGRVQPPLRNRLRTNLTPVACHDHSPPSFASQFS